MRVVLLRVILTLVVMLFSASNLCNGLPLFSTFFGEKCNYDKYYITDAIIINHKIGIYLNTSKIVVSIANKTSIDNKPNKYNKNSNNEILITKDKKIDKQKQNETLETLETLYNGAIILLFKTMPHCIFKCKSLVVEDQYTEKSVLNYLNTFYKNNWTIKDLKCNSHGCTNKDIICSVIQTNDEL